VRLEGLRAQTINRTTFLEVSMFWEVHTYNSEENSTPKITINGITSQTTVPHDNFKNALTVNNNDCYNSTNN
jgi:hypothetical protein